MGLDMYLERAPRREREGIGYWRKANQIHKWFVDNVQNGEDDCGSYEVTKDDLENLLETCKKVLASCKLVDGDIVNGHTLKDGKFEPNIIKGKCIEDARVAEELLPTMDGFFFGGTGYDEYYVSDIEETIEIITNALESTDFETETIYYSSSW